MRVRTFLRRIRLELGLSIEAVAARTGLAKGEVSMLERGHSVPRDDQVLRMVATYGPPTGWYPATVQRALLGDLLDCPGCGDELDPGASGGRRYHNDGCRTEFRRHQERMSE